MKRKLLNIKLKDYRHTFNEPHKKKPYYLYVEWGNRNFYFSNKRKAERFLKKFQKESTDIHRELNIMLFETFKINCLICEHLNIKQAKDFREEIIWFADNFQKQNLGNFGGNCEIGLELKRVLNVLIKHLGVYRVVLRKNNRYRYLYEDVRFKIKQAKRLKKEFDVLLSGADGIHEITSDFVAPLTYENKITIVA